MKIYIHATAPWSPSSYSVLTARTVPNIVRAGHDVTIGVWYGLSGQPLPWTIDGENGDKKTVTVLPHHQVGGNMYGEAMLYQNYKYSQADICITICDVFVFPPAVTGKTVFCPWLPVDIDPAPDGILNALSAAVYPMVYSQWGTNVLKAAGVDAHYVPCSAPANTFKPGDKAAAREMLMPGKKCDFLVTMVAANKSGDDRKGFGEALQGFAKFVETHPDSLLYVHTDWGGPIRIGNIARRLGIEKHLIQPDQYALINGMLSEEYMANVYRASDVLLNPCKSEGFGLPLVEAQMCGCPIAATDFATTDELMFAGWKLPGQLDWYIGAESWRMRVHIDGIVAALEDAYAERNNERLRRRAHNGAIRYDNKLVFKDYWKPALADIEKIIQKGKKVYDFAKSFSVVPVQGRGWPADRLVPQTDQQPGLPTGQATAISERGRQRRQYPGRVADVGDRG